VLCGYLIFSITSGCLGSLKCSESKNTSLPVFYEENQNQRSVDSSYFRNIKELIVFMKEPAKNQKLESWIFQRN
jgi:hypothetical protein